MPGYWESNLQVPALDDLPMPVRRVNKRGGREGARHKFAYRDGQAIEDTGRKPRVYEIEVPLFRDVSESHYPIRKENLVRYVEDPNRRGEVTYTDAEDGEIRAKVMEYEWSADPEGARDGGVLRLVIEENNIDLSSEGLDDADPLAQSLELAIAFDQYLIDLPDSEVTEFREDTSFLDTMVETVDKLYRDVDDLANTADEYAAYIDTFTNQMNRIINYPPFSDVERWTITNAAADLVGMVTEAIRTKQSSEPAFTEYTTTGYASVHSIAAELYGDAVRGPEIAFNNNLENPLVIPPGVTLLVLPE